MEKELCQYIHDELSKINNKTRYDNYKEILSYYENNNSIAIESECIICLDNELEQLCNKIAPKNKLTLYKPEMNHLVNFMKKEKIKTATIIGTFNNFRYKNLEILNKISKENEILFNIITGKDYLSILFNVLKCGKRLRHELTKLKIGKVNAFEYKDENSEVKKFLEKNFFESLIIAAHGEGLHLNLNDTVVCGNILTNEIDSKKCLIENGCTLNECRKLNDKNIVNLVKADKIKASSIYMLTCNGFSVNHELFDTESNLINGLLSGSTNEILTTIQAEELNSSMIKLIEILIKNNYTIDTIAWIMNDIEYLKNHSLPFITINSRNLFNKILKKINLNQTFNIGTNEVLLILHEFKINKQIFYYDQDKEEDTRVYLGYRSLIILKENISITNFKICNGTKEFYDIKNKSNTLLKTMYRINSFLELVSQNKNKLVINKYNQYIKDSICELNNIFKYLNEVELNHLYDARKIKKFYKYIDVKKINLQKIILRLFIDIDINNNFEKIFRENCYKKYVVNEENLMCIRCNNKIQKYELKTTKRIEDSEYKMIFCPICGVKSISKCNINIESEGCVNKEYIIIKLKVNMNKVKLLKKHYILIDVTDKSKGNRVNRFIDLINLENDLKIKITKKEDLSKDLHSYKGTIIFDSSIGYFHGKFQE